MFKSIRCCATQLASGLLYLACGSRVNEVIYV
jgi:hypothetical protein